MRNFLVLLVICLACVGWKSNGGWDSGPVYTRSFYERATTSDTITANESGKAISISCVGCVFTLPTAQPGLTYTFVAETANTFSVDPASTADTIRYLSLSAGDKVTSEGNTADSVELISTQANFWNVKAMKGTFTDGN